MSEQVLLRIVTTRDDRTGAFEGVPETVLRRVRELGLAGATVLRESDPTDHRGVLAKAARPLLPTMVEIVDTAAAIDSAIDELLRDLPPGVVVVREPVDAVRGSGGRP